jgi:hypothetical protein
MAYINGKEVLFSPSITIGEGYDKGFEEGKKAGNDALWDMITQHGTRTDFGYAFSRWDSEYIRPNRKIIPTTANGSQSTFYACPYLKKIEAAYFDFSQKAYGGGAYNFFAHSCSSLEEIEDIGLIAQPKYDYAFGYCTKLKTIAKMGVDESTTFVQAFDACRSLANITVDGTIGKSISFKDCPLTVASMESIIDALKDYANTDYANTYTLTFNDAAWARLDAAHPDIVSGWDSYRNYISINYGWNT